MSSPFYTQYTSTKVLYTAVMLSRPFFSRPRRDQDLSLQDRDDQDLSLQDRDLSFKDQDHVQDLPISSRPFQDLLSVKHGYKN